MDKQVYLTLNQVAMQLRPSNRIALWHTLHEICLIFVAIYCALSTHVVVWIIGEVLLFICFWRCFSILHSCAHNAFFEHRLGNLVMGYITSIFALVPFAQWKQSHLAHHRFVGKKGYDPSLNLPSSESVSRRFKTFLNICWRLNIPIFSVLTTLGKNNQLPKKRSVSLNLFSICLILFSHALLALSLGMLYLKIFLPVILMYLLTSDYLIISQHNIIPAEKRGPEPSVDEPSVPLSEQDRFSRTLKFPIFISRFVLLYFDKHELHHVVPYVPHYEIKHLPSTYFVEQPIARWFKEIRSMPGHKVYLE